MRRDMNLYVAAALAATLAIFAEYLYKTLPPGTPYVQHLWWWIPQQLLIGYCIWTIVRNTETLLHAAIVWSWCTIIFRITVSLIILGEHIPTRTWVAVALITLAKLVQTLK